jgi:hypothetical protein
MTTFAIKVIVIMVILYIPYYIIATKFSNWLGKKFKLFREDRNENRDR